MYIFVFMWTPKLEPHFEPLPHGRVFGCYIIYIYVYYIYITHTHTHTPHVEPLPHGRVFG